MIAKKTPIGVIKNNPFDLMWNAAFVWVGQVTPQPVGTRLLSFDTALQGIRAGMIDARTDLYKHKLDTLEKIIPPFAPPNENDTEQYIKNMEVIMMIGRKDKLDFSTIGGLVDYSMAIVQCEVGQGWYTEGLFISAAKLVFARGEIVA